MKIPAISTYAYASSTFPLICLLLTSHLFAATDVLVRFTLNTTDPYGAAIQQNRYYYIYRPDNLPKTTPVPMVLLLDGGAPTIFHRKADQAGFVVVSCSFSGNSTGTPGTVWINDNPRISGYEDYDYLTEVINRVRASDNCRDAFTVGLSKNGHMSLAYACEKPDMIKAAASLDEFMGLTSNIPTAPVPIMVFQGTVDTNVPYVMVRDTVDAWRAVDGLLSAQPVTTYEPSPLVVGKATQTTWRGGTGGTQVAFVTITGGSHTYPTPSVQTGYDFTDGVWAFFSQFLSAREGAPKIVSQPVDNIQVSGQPASFWVSASGSAPLSYQWQKNGRDIPGATSNWYTLPATTPDDSGATFRAVATNDFGPVTSPAAELAVKAAPAGPAITIQPLNQSVVAGQPVTFTASTTGVPPLTYQWQKNGVNIAGATDPSLTIPAAITPDCGANFTVIAKNAAGSVTSNRAMLTVTPAQGAPIIPTNPVRARVLAGQTATFSVAAWSAKPMSYQWQSGVFVGNMVNIPGATAATYTTPSTTLTDHLTLLRCVVSNAVGNATSASEMLFVTTAPAAPNQITSLITASAQLGNPFSYIITSSGGTIPITYSAKPLPHGLSLDPSSGLISGTPAEAGTTSIAINASNSAGNVSAILTLTVSETPPVVTIDSWRLANFGASAIDPTIAGDMADPDGDGYTNLDEFAFGSNPLDPVSKPSGETSPLSISTVANAANYVAGKVAPGEIIVVYGSNFGPAALVQLQYTNGVAITTLGNTRIYFDNVAAPMIYAVAGSPSVLSCVVPYSVKTSTQVQVEYNGVKGNTLTVPVVDAAPGIFSQDQSGTGPGAILNWPDYTLNGSSNRVAAGGYIMAYATGEGKTDIAIDGQKVPLLGPYPKPLLTPWTATVGGKPATVTYSGSAPDNIAGLFQVNVQIPSDLTMGVYDLVIKAASFPSTAGLTVAVK